MVKCEECNSSQIYVDAEEDVYWCKSCGYSEGVDFHALPEQKGFIRTCEDL